MNVESIDSQLLASVGMEKSVHGYVNLPNTHSTALKGECIQETTSLCLFVGVCMCVVCVCVFVHVCVFVCIRTCMCVCMLIPTVLILFVWKTSCTYIHT